MTTRILLVQPDPLGQPFELAGCLAAEGVAVDHVRPFEDGRAPRALDADGLVVLGGNMSSRDDDEFAWLEDIRLLQRSAAAQGRPSLGICLGAQLMAQAFGGTTSLGDAGLETGVVEVSWLPGAEGDPLVGGLRGPHLAAAMHGDEVATLPPGATWLASGHPYRHQAFRVGEASWGVQFHPELNHEGYRLWADAHESPTIEDAERLRRGGEELARAESEILGLNRALLGRFLQLVRERRRLRSR